MELFLIGSLLNTGPRRQRAAAASIVARTRSRLARSFFEGKKALLEFFDGPIQRGYRLAGGHRTE